MSDTAVTEAEPFIPYVEEADYPEPMREQLTAYVERMGVIPNALKFYLHRPEIAATLWTLNDRVMRHESSTLDLNLKRRLAAVVSAVNGCAYCTSHHCTVLKGPRGAGVEGWDMSDEELSGMLSGDTEPADEMERACFDFVRAAATDASNVPPEILDRLKEHLTPPQIVELACLAGFWAMYNTVHDSLSIPIEAVMQPNAGYVDKVR
jgi:uncharacterized peroxidase-related enzyme